MRISDWSSDVCSSDLGDGRYSSRFNTWGRDNDPGYYRKEVMLVNASIAVAGFDDAWKVTVYGSNLTNQKVISGAISAGATPIQQYYQPPREFGVDVAFRSEEHTSELQSLMRNSYAVFCLKKKKV